MIVRGLTWQGHDLIDSIRDPKIWEKTKKESKVPEDSPLIYLRTWQRALLKSRLRNLRALNSNSNHGLAAAHEASRFHEIASSYRVGASSYLWMSKQLGQRCTPEEAGK